MVKRWTQGLVLVVGLTAAPVGAEYGLEGSIAAYRWVEDFGALDVKEYGPVFQGGGYVSGSPSRSFPPLILRGEMRLLVGQVGYDTYTQNLVTRVLTPTSTRTSYIGYTNEGSVGLRQPTEVGYAEPFLSLGYRWWRRHIRGDGGYAELYRLLYGRVGVRTEHRMGGVLRLRTTLSLDHPLWARERVDLSSSAFLDPDSGALIEGRQFTVANGRHPGWTIEVGIGRGLVDVTAYWQAVRLGESNSALCYDSLAPAARRYCYQPESHQDLFGLRAGFAF